jgi:hypothetical protein
MAQVDITIKKTSSGCKVLPPYPSLQVGDTINWRNRTGARIIVFFPHDTALGTVVAGVPNPKAHFHLRIPAGGNDGPAEGALSQGAGTVVSFPYVIWCNATNDWAIGSSDPEIIIES